MAEQQAQAAAEELVADRFTFAMNAATSKYGILADITFAFAASGLVGMLAAICAAVLPHVSLLACVLVTVVPLVVCVLVQLGLRDARSKVVQWLREVPFPIYNVNAVLSGAGEEFQIQFSRELPSREQVMGFFEQASDQVFVLEVDEERKLMQARFGVIDSKHNPIYGAHVRYDRMQLVVRQALIPLHTQYPITHLQIV